MRLTLCGIASKYIHQNLAPWCLKAGLFQYGIHDSCQVIELNVNQPLPIMLEAIVKSRPDIAGFSCYIWNINTVRSLAASLKLLYPQVVIVLGGPEAGSRPGSVFELIPQADYVITGPGEYAFAELVRRLPEKRDCSDIPGLSYRRDGILLSNPPSPLPLSMPSPYSKECMENLKGRMAYAETSRGCPFRCTFCLSGQEVAVTFLPLDKTKETLLQLAASGTKTVKLTDRTFNFQKERAYEIFRFLIDKKKENAFGNVCFHFEVAADLFDHDTILLLQSAPPGLFQMEAGLQSFHKETLEACRRRTDLSKLCDNITLLMSKQNIHIHLDLIAGLPYEDFETFGESVNKAFALRPHMLQLGFLKLLYGSRLRDQREEFGILHTPDPPYEVLKTNWLSYADICLLKKCELALEKLYNSQKFRRTLQYVFQSSCIKPFDLFLSAGEIFANAEGNLSLDQITELAFHHFGSIHGILPAALRDIMAHDRLATDNTGRLPDCLAVRDPRLKSALSNLRRELPPEAKPGAAILYEGGERLVWADYSKKHPVTGEYDTAVIPL